MADFAIIQTGGKQYKVAAGQKLEVELLKNAGEAVTFETLLTSKNGKVTIGKPVIKTGVKAKVVGEAKGEKIDVRTYKAKSRHRRHIGHRQKYSVVEIESI